MTRIKISQLTEDTAPTANDVLPVTDVETGVTKKVKIDNLSQGMTNVVHTTGNEIINGIKTLKGIETVIDTPLASQGRIVIKAGGVEAWTVYRPGNTTDLRFYNNTLGQDAFEIQGPTSDLTHKGNNLTSAWTAYTPAITPQTGTITSYGQQSGAYKVIGKTVNFWLAINVSNFGTASGRIAINFPIVASNSARLDIPLAGFACDAPNNPVTLNKGVPVIDGSGTISFLTGVNASALTIASCTVNTHFRVSGSYNID
jgi:hypothetical protein